MKKFLSVLAIVLVIAAFMVVPAFAQDGTPPVAPPAFDMAQISAALQSLILALLVPVAGFAARWLFAQGSYQKQLLSTEQQYALELFIKTCVYAAEQMQLSKFVNNKLDHVTELVNSWLAAQGLSMDAAELRARIEAAVREAFPPKKISAE